MLFVLIKIFVVMEKEKRNQLIKQVVTAIVSILSTLLGVNIFG